MHESLEVPSHGIPNARTGPQPDKMWRTNTVEEEQLKHRQQQVFILVLLKKSINHKYKEHMIQSRKKHEQTSTSLKTLSSITVVIVFPQMTSLDDLTIFNAAHKV